MKLYTYFRSSAAYRARIALNLKGVTTEQISIHLTKDGGKQHSPEYRAVNPQRRVPSLVLDNGTDRIVDSSDVADYRPILTFTAGHAYTHGYRRDVTPPVTYAGNEISAPLSLAQATFEPAYGQRDQPEVVRETASLVPETIDL